jgi:hypothetical protein
LQGYDVERNPFYEKSHTLYISLYDRVVDDVLYIDLLDVFRWYHAYAFIKPGQQGLKKLCAQHGNRLVCVRDRYDAQRHKRFKTVELIVEECDWEPSVPRLTRRLWSVFVSRGWR